MKFSDAVAHVLKEFGVKDFFAVTGGAAVHLIDSLQRSGLNPTFTHHEQSAALAADSYARSQGIGVCVTTTGPGVTNAITGTLCSWQDSTPTVFISGQSRTTNIADGFQVRQAGTQHLKVEEVVSSIVKQVISVRNPVEDLPRIVGAIELATLPRMGPVWIDIPLDVQLEPISQETLQTSLELVAKIKSRESGEFDLSSEEEKSKFKRELLMSLNSSQRPVAVFGSGIMSEDIENVRDFAAQLSVPFVTTWGAAGHPIEMLDSWSGRIGVSGMRGANKAIMESDLILVLGARLGQSTTGSRLDDFARGAKILVCEIDREEISYLRERKAVIALNTSIRDFIKTISAKEIITSWVDSNRWRARVSRFKKQNIDEYDLAENKKSRWNQYLFLRVLSSHRKNIEKCGVVIDGGGTIVYSSMQVLEAEPLQKIIIPAASAPMGTAPGHAIGLAKACDQPVIALIGDGSFMLNLQELSVIKALNLPITFFVFENQGYLSIRNTQDQFLAGKHLGSSEEGGLYVTDISSIAKLFGLKYKKITPDSQGQLRQIFEDSVSEPQIIEVPVRLDQDIYPRVQFKKIEESNAMAPMPLSEMYPERLDDPER